MKEGFWDKDHLMPVVGTYHNQEVIARLHRINEIVHHQDSRLAYDMYVNDMIGTAPVYAIGYCGYSHCRLCDKIDNGDMDIHICKNGEELIYPDGYVHYLEKHGVAPTQRFERIIMSVTEKDLIRRASTI